MATCHAKPTGFLWLAPMLATRRTLFAEVTFCWMTHHLFAHIQAVPWVPASPAFGLPLQQPYCLLFVGCSVTCSMQHMPGHQLAACRLVVVVWTVGRRVVGKLMVDGLPGCCTATNITLLKQSILLCALHC